MRPAVNPAYEASELRSQAYLARRDKEEPKHFEIGEEVAVRAVNCFQCHYRMGEPPPADPIAWAPDLNRVRERLRESWVHDWLVNPGTVYPGTAMPANFSGDPPQYQDVYPDSTNAQQLQVVLEWLYNFDRIYMGTNAPVKTAKN
jgi:mono/diheme cytochrome c family protein